MKKNVFFNLFLIFVLFFSSINNAAFAKKSKLVSKDELRNYQTKLYENKNANDVYKAVLEILESQNYKTEFDDSELLYIKAKKQLSKKEISYWLIATYMAKTGMDVAQSILTYGLKSYTLVGDIWLIRNEFKDKTSNLTIAVNITPLGNDTKVRVNMVDVTTGQRDIFLQRMIAGKENRIRTVTVNDSVSYKIFYRRLDRALGLSDSKQKQVEI